MSKMFGFTSTYKQLNIQYGLSLSHVSVSNMVILVITDSVVIHWMSGFGN